jgi:hypothetical protein
VADVVHAMVTDEGEYGYSMTSPQFPELAFGRSTEEEFTREYQDALRYAGLKSGRVWGHFQVRGTTPQGVEFVIRRQTGDGHEEARLQIANAINRLLSSETEATQLLEDLEPSATGEFVFVACLADDTVGWLVDQLRPNDDAIAAALDVAGVMVAMTQVASGGHLDWPTIDDLGWTRDTTLGELLTRKTASVPLSLRA